MSETVSFETLKERFSTQVVNPFGPCVVIPRRLFQRGWELDLEAQGHRVFCSSHKGESCFLVRLDKGESRNVESRQKRDDAVPNSSKEITAVAKPSKRGVVDHWKRWKPKEVRRLQEMLKEGLGVDKIAEVLDRTEQAVQRKIQRLRRKGFDLPATESKVAPPPAPSSVTTQVDEDHLIEELLAVANEIYPKYRQACRFLLLETSRLLEAQTSS